MQFTCVYREVALEQSPLIYTSLLGAGHRRGPDAWRVATAAADGLCGIFSRSQACSAVLRPISSEHSGRRIRP